MNETQQLINKLFNQLPNDLQNILYQIIKNDQISVILRKYRISTELQDAIKEEIFLILIGINEMSDFELNIKNILEINHEQVIAISREIEKKIFFPVQQSLSELDVFSRHLSNNTYKNNNENENINSKNLDGIAPINHEKTNEIKDKSIIPQIFKKRLPKMNGEQTTNEKQNIPQENVSRFKPKINNNDSKSDPYREPIE